MTTPTQALVARVRDGLSEVDAKLDYPDERGPRGPAVMMRCALLAQLADDTRALLALVEAREGERGVTLMREAAIALDTAHGLHHTQSWRTCNHGEPCDYLSIAARLYANAGGSDGR